MSLANCREERSTFLQILQIFITSLLNWPIKHQTSIRLINSLAIEQWRTEAVRNPAIKTKCSSLLRTDVINYCLAAPQRPLERLMSALQHFEVLLPPLVMPFLHHCTVPAGHNSMQIQLQVQLVPFHPPASPLQTYCLCSRGLKKTESKAGIFHQHYLTSTCRSLFGSLLWPNSSWKRILKKPNNATRRKQGIL